MFTAKSKRIMHSFCFKLALSSCRYAEWALLIQWYSRSLSNVVHSFSINSVTVICTDAKFVNFSSLSHCLYETISSSSKPFQSNKSTSDLRPWHDVWAKACSSNITRVNQEIGALRGQWKARPNVTLCGVISLAQNCK